jgi:hypothetical protein
MAIYLSRTSNKDNIRLSERAKVLDLSILTRSISVTKDRSKIISNYHKMVIECMVIATVFFAAFFAILHFAFSSAHAASSSVAADGNIFTAVWSLVSGWGGLNYTVKINAIMTLLISSMKVSFLAPLWNKIKDIKITYRGVVQHINFQTYFVLFLHIIVGIITQGNYSFTAILAYVFIGGGSVYFHELADGLKNVPIIGTVLEWIETVAKYILKAPVTDTSSKLK